MSKTEDVRKRSMGMGLGEDMGWSRNGASQTSNLKDMEMLEVDATALSKDIVSVMNKQLHFQTKNFMEVNTRTEELIKSINSASDNVRSSANEVRAYPAEVVSQLSTRLEICVARCEDAAKRAVEVFEKAKSTHMKLERNYLMLLFTACMGVGAIMGSMFVFMPKLFS